MKKSDSLLSVERVEAENAALLLEVVDSILTRLDPSVADVPDPHHPVQIANTHVRLAMGFLAAALTGEEAPPPSGLFRYLARIFGGAVPCVQEIRGRVGKRQSAGYICELAGMINSSNDRDASPLGPPPD